MSYKRSVLLTMIVLRVHERWNRKTFTISSEIVWLNPEHGRYAHGIYG